MPNIDGRPTSVWLTNDPITTTYTSSRIEVWPFKHVGIQTSWVTSNLNGTLYVRASIDGTIYETLPIGSTTVSVALTGSSGNQAFDIRTKGFAFLHLYFVYTSGTGTISASYLAKGNIYQ